MLHDLFFKKQMTTPKPSPAAIFTHCLLLTRMSLSHPKASSHHPPLQPISRQERLCSTLLLTCVVHCIWPAVPAAACPTGRPGGGWWEQTAGTTCITDTTTALETRRRSWVTAAAWTTAAASGLSIDTSRLWPAPSTSTTAHKDTGRITLWHAFSQLALRTFWHFGNNHLLPNLDSLPQTSRICLTSFDEILLSY